MRPDKHFQTIFLFIFYPVDSSSGAFRLGLNIISDGDSATIDLENMTPTAPQSNYVAWIDVLIEGVGFC
jgi:hypothetical protein